MTEDWTSPPFTMKTFIKRFPHTPYEDIRREARLQRRAAGLGISPKVIRCNHNSIVMEKIDEMCIADKYGETIENLPEWLKEDILDLLYTLYTVLAIEYVDVTPYNFIEKDGVVWVIDFGHARNATYDLDPYLDEAFAEWNLTKWNDEFT